MPPPETITQTVDRYLDLVAKGATDEILALYAPDATLEDPIGSDLRRGHGSIREFYAGFQDLKKDTELAEIRVADSEAAFLWHLTLDAGDSRTRISPISVMTFDEDAKSRRCARFGRLRTSRSSEPAGNSLLWHKSARCPIVIATSKRRRHRRWGSCPTIGSVDDRARAHHRQR